MRILVGVLVFVVVSAIFALAIIGFSTTASAVGGAITGLMSGPLAFLGSFLPVVKFLGLTLFYLAAFTLLVTFARWSWPRLAGSPESEQPTLGGAFKGAVGKLGLTPGSHDDFRFEYLLVACVITFVIALAKPTPPLLAGALDDMKEIIPAGARSSVANGWHVFWYGGQTPQIPVPAPIKPEATWFWWGALITFAIFTAIQFLYEFSEDIGRGISVAVAKIREGISAAREEMKRNQEEARNAAAKYQATYQAAQQAAQQQGGKKGKKGWQQAAPPPPPPPAQPPTSQGWVGDLLRIMTVDVFMEGVYAFLKEVANGFLSKKSRRWISTPREES